jgi:hypothetical protein
LITNADQGVLYSWDLGFNGASPAHQLTTITAGSLGSQIALAAPGSVQPVLQQEDGSLIGTVTTQQGSSMVAFDQSGNFK